VADFVRNNQLKNPYEKDKIFRDKDPNILWANPNICVKVKVVAGY